MKRQILSSRKNKKKTISKCRLLKILPRLLSVKHNYFFDSNPLKFFLVYNVCCMSNENQNKMDLNQK